MQKCMILHKHWCLIQICLQVIAILIDIDTAEGKLQKAAVKRNKIAMANFTMAFTSKGTMSLIYQAETRDWPNGLASLVTDALKAKYMPKAL
jgi:hypothetical protein